MWIMEIFVWDEKAHERVWKAVRPSGAFSKTYRFDTEEEARSMLCMCYGEVVAEHRRVRKLKEGVAL